MAESFCWWGLCEGVYIPQFLMSYVGIGPAAKLCFARIIKYTGTNETCWPSQEQLAKDLGVSVRAIGTYLAELEQDGFIEIIRRGLRQSNEYKPLPHSIALAALRGTPSDQETQGSSDQETQGSSDHSIELKEIIGRKSDGKCGLNGSTSEDLSERLPPETLIRLWSGTHGLKRLTQAERRHVKENWSAEISEEECEEALRRFSQWYKTATHYLRSPVVVFMRDPFSWTTLRTIEKPQPDISASVAPAPSTELVLTWQSDAEYGRYLFELARTGKRVSAKVAKDGFDIWCRLTPQQKAACIEDIKYLVAQASEFKYGPNPVGHLSEEPWNALRMPAAPKIADSKQARALVIALERQARRDRGEVVL
jgi:biotin operon repressor